MAEPARAAGRLRIGTSGWSYRSWHGDFYPDGVGPSDELSYLSRHTTATEINASFYRLQSPATYRRWAEATPPDHAFALKGSRYLTHMKQLHDPEPGLAKLLASGVRELGSKLEVMLWQLPARTSFDPDLLDGFLTARPADVKHALEPRHPSFASAEARAVLTAHDVATVYSDSPDVWPALDQDTASFRYVRLHGHSALYASRYADRSLEDWAAKVRRWHAAGQDVHVYFDNDAHGHAPHDAVRLLEKLR